MILLTEVYCNEKEELMGLVNDTTRLRIDLNNTTRTSCISLAKFIGRRKES